MINKYSINEKCWRKKLWTSQMFALWIFIIQIKDEKVISCGVTLDNTVPPYVLHSSPSTRWFVICYKIMLVYIKLIINIYIYIFMYYIHYYTYINKYIYMYMYVCNVHTCLYVCIPHVCMYYALAVLYMYYSMYTHTYMYAYIQ